MTKVDAFQFARQAARAADDKIGEDIMVFDVRKESSLADCYLLITGTSHIHIRALEDAVRDALRDSGAQLRRTDGQRGHLWRALDYGSLIVHIMDHKTREFYAMEKLWERGKIVDWADKTPVKTASRKKSPARKKAIARKRAKSSSPRKRGSRS